MLKLDRRDLLLGGAAGILGAPGAHAQTPKRGGTLNAIVTPEPPVLVLGINYQGPTQLVGGKIYQGLCKYSFKLEPLPELAKSWSLSDDKKTYTFELQDNVKFHDGTPMTADDVVFSVTKFWATLSPRARAIFAKIKEATAPDPHTVVFTLDSPFEPFMLMFDDSASAIVPKHIYDGTDYRTNPANQHPIGTGPFQFVEWQRGNFIHLKRFEQYYKPGQPYLDEIIFHVIPDSQSRALALESGKVQLATATDLEPFDVQRFKAMPNYEVETRGYEYPSTITWFEINHRVKPLGDVRVRQAISHAIDRNFIVDRLWSGIGKVATGPIASTTPFYDPAVAKLQPFDPQKAMQLLDAAGYPANAKGVRFTIKHLPLPYGEVYIRLSEYFRSALQKVGIEVILESTDAGAWVGRVGSWELRNHGQQRLAVRRPHAGRGTQLRLL